MKKIGITSCIIPPDNSRNIFQKKTLFAIESDMTHFFSSKKIMPILIPNFSSKKILENFVSEMDGIVFHGGDDLSPETYREKHLDYRKWPGNLSRDIYELKVMDLAFKKKIPVLGICRGFQLINVYFGGNLYQDIDTQVNLGVKHKDINLYDRCFHDINFAENSLLSSEIYPRLKGGLVNSIHHQSIQNLGKNLFCEAKSKNDNLIEAFRYYNMHERYIYAVQWHPEFQHNDNVKSLDPRNILQHFIKKVNTSI